MENLVTYSLYIFLALAALSILLYMPRIICWFGAFTKQEQIKSDVDHKFAILVPARNESKIITQILDCFKEQTYDAKNFDVYVIVKDKNDKTIDICKKYGYNTFVSETQTSKAEALDDCFKYLLAKKDNNYDDYIIFDADAWLDKKCLEELNNATASGKDIITARKIVKNYRLPKENRPISSLCNGVLWTEMDEMGNKFKSKHGIRMMTITTGMLLKKSVIERLGGFPFKDTLTEDMELMYSAPLYNFSEYYAGNAIIYMEEANTRKVNNQRRQRWISGYVCAKRLYAKRLRKSAKTFHSKLEYYFFLGIYHAFTIYSIPLIFALFNFVLTIILLLDGSPLIYQSLLNILYAALYSYATLFIHGIFILAADRKVNPSSVGQTIAIALYFPIHYIGYTRMALKALFGSNPKEWVEIERNDIANVNTTDAIKKKAD
ncbi:MAG: glycosyltransferase family 2 protein [Bacilli bacterium]|nr:glycosyltransferase family 2 protein [Bacilli bacterium]